MADSKVGGDAKAAFGLGLGIAILASLIDNGALGWLLMPVVLGLFIFAMFRAPLRASLLTLMFFAFTLENPSEQFASGAWKSPIASLGRLMLMHLKETVGGGLFFSGMDIMLGCLAVVVFVRSISKSRIDRAGAVATPRPMIRLAHLSLATMVFMWVYGLLRGGNSSMALWQVDRVIYLPCIFLLFSVGLRGPKDHAAVAKVVIAAALIRASLAMYIQWGGARSPDPTTGEPSALEFATTHNDSMLFAFASVIIGALLLQRVSKKSLWLAALATPILIGGMLANDRRMVWVQIILVFAIMYVATPTNAVKRKLQKTVLFTSPLVLGYLVAGWNSSSSIFKPVQTIRSAVDSDADSSTQWRDIENLDLVLTFHQNPIFGSGYGHPFYEFQPLPQVGYMLEHYIPHNSILGLWAYGGFVGYTGLTLLWASGVYFGMRAYHASKERSDKAAALAAFGAVPIYFLQCYGDMGLGSWTGVYMMASALAVAGKLAVATGAWSGSTKSAATARASAAAPVGTTVPPRAASPSP